MKINKEIGWWTGSVSSCLSFSAHLSYYHYYFGLEKDEPKKEDMKPRAPFLSSFFSSRAREENSKQRKVMSWGPRREQSLFVGQLISKFLNFQADKRKLC